MIVLFIGLNGRIGPVWKIVDIRAIVAPVNQPNMGTVYMQELCSGNWS